MHFNWNRRNYKPMEIPEENRADSLLGNKLQAGSMPKFTMRTLWDDHFVEEEAGSGLLLNNHFASTPQVDSTRKGKMPDILIDNSSISLLNSDPGQEQRPTMHFNWDTAVERKRKEQEKKQNNESIEYSAKTYPVKGESWGNVKDPLDLADGEVEPRTEEDKKPYLKPMAHRVIKDTGDSPSRPKYTFSLNGKDLGGAETEWDLDEVINIVSKTTLGRTFLEGLKTKGTQIKAYGIKGQAIAIRDRNEIGIPPNFTTKQAVLSLIHEAAHILRGQPMPEDERERKLASEYEAFLSEVYFYQELMDVDPEAAHYADFLGSARNNLKLLQRRKLWKKVAKAYDINPDEEPKLGFPDYPTH